jgi:hypothetical protein
MFIPVFSPVITADEQVEPLLFVGGVVDFTDVTDAILTAEGVVYAS